MLNRDWLGWSWKKIPPWQLLITIYLCLWSRYSYTSTTNIQTYFPDTEYELTVYQIQGDEKGKTLLIIGGIHGDEPSCFLAADTFADIHLKKGNILLIPRVNLPAVRAGKRFINKDLNRRFTKGQTGFYEDDLADVVKLLMAQCDFLINLHEGEGFYRQDYETANHNQMKYGQSIIADTDSLLFNHQTLNLQKIANIICQAVNRSINESEYHFRFNNHRTSHQDTQHAEQRKSATYYALMNYQIPAFGVEVSRQLPSQSLKNFYTELVIYEFMKYMDIEITQELFHEYTPVFHYLLATINGDKRYFEKDDIIEINTNTTFQINKLVTNYARGNRVEILGFSYPNALLKSVIISKNTELIVYRDHEKLASIPIYLHEQDAIFAGIRLRLLYDQSTINLAPNDTLALTDGADFEIIGPINHLQNYSLIIPGATIINHQNRKIIDTATCLNEKFTLDPSKKIYEILVQDKNQIIATSYIKLCPIIPTGLHLLHNGKNVIMAPGDTLFTNYNDVIYLVDVELNQLPSHKVKVNFAGYIVDKNKEAEDRNGEIILNNFGLIPSFATTKNKNQYEIHVLYKQKKWASYFVSIKMPV